MIPARLFVKSGNEIRSREGTTQGDPTSMATYAIGLTPLLDNLQSISSGIEHVAFADDLTGAGKSHQIKSWWDHLQVKGTNYGYYSK